MRLPFSLLGFNRIALVTLPGEIFTEHGLAVKNLYPGKLVMIGELTDTDEDGYVPTREAFVEAVTRLAAPPLYRDQAKRWWR